MQRFTNVLSVAKKLSQISSLPIRVLSIVAKIVAKLKILPGFVSFAKAPVKLAEHFQLCFYLNSSKVNHIE